MDIADFARMINPRQTVVLLGAGASIPSGAPSGSELGRKLARKLNGAVSADSYRLSEICSVFERQHGRQHLAETVRDLLQSLSPTGALQLLPGFDWYRIYTTNFDTLVEQVYQSADVPLTVRRSNFDFSRGSSSDRVELFKIHGCITEDIGLGHQTRMLLTETDYEDYDDFRQAAFRALESDVLTKDVLVIGQSLEDEHLRDIAREALKLAGKSGAQGRVLLLSYQEDGVRADLQRSRGAAVAFGGLDDLFAHLVANLPPDETTDQTSGDFVPSLLPNELVSTTVDIRHAGTLSPDARSLFNGSPAKYADIIDGLAFERSEQTRITRSLAEKPIAVILGSGGVGKTTLARQIASELAHAADAAWEHNSAFPLSAGHWIEYEGRLRQAGQHAVLVVDDCVDHLAGVSQLADHIGEQTAPALRLILTATTGRWRQRTKSRRVFTHGEAFTLSRLTRDDIDALLNLTADKTAIRALVDEGFMRLPRTQQVRILRERCSADMYVCMKNIFASEELDFILLREFGELDPAAQDIYRLVGALEALGARVHRQLIVRLLQIEVGSLMAVLDSLTGVVSEVAISESSGLYGWTTRHREIAATIARYKYADQSELYRLFDNLVDSFNPSLRLEVETARALCTEELGINRLADPDQQVELLQRVIRVLPGEGIPRHRLIRKLIDQDRLDEASAELRAAHEAIRMNPVLARYEVLILSRRSELTHGLMDEDRAALLWNAEAKARQLLQKYPDDMHSYRVFADVAIKLSQRTGNVSPLADAMSAARKAEGRLLDPALGEVVARIEEEQRRSKVVRAQSS
ncbi:SIR2 family protein [Aeromicrobium sp.]|uniref:SIR2 family protein n=1 Tax=Aeromicrobium sp. TaxID=1871063 RepID=UPI0025BAB2CA|nr:SIR2 family protein [Aeromicrobium sp.]MCK5892638.1 SIR2 family protein [Aeromicrobium sp.]